MESFLAPTTKVGNASFRPDASGLFALRVKTRKLFPSWPHVRFRRPHKTSYQKIANWVTKPEQQPGVPTEHARDACGPSTERLPDRGDSQRERQLPPQKTLYCPCCQTRQPFAVAEEFSQMVAASHVVPGIRVPQLKPGFPFC